MGVSPAHQIKHFDVSGTVIPVVTCYECGTIMDHGEALAVVECGCCGLKHESDLKYRNEDHIYDITHMTGGRLFMEETGPSELRSRKMYKRRAIRQMTKTRYVFGIRAFCQLCADLANGKMQTHCCQVERPERRSGLNAPPLGERMGNLRI